MMTREMMEEIFEDYCGRYDLDWYELFDSDMFLDVATEIAIRAGLEIDETADEIDFLMESLPEFAVWYSEMAMDL